MTSASLSTQALCALSSVAAVAAWMTAAFSLLFSAACVVAAGRFRARRTPPPSPLPPPLTVLKPVKGLDPGMRENLSSFLRQDYPGLQVVFCVADPSDPALPLIGALRREHPSVDTALVVSSGKVGRNPKVNNLSNAEPFIKHGFVLISDSDIRLEDPGDLRRIVSPMLSDPEVGLVTCLYQCRGLGRRGAFLEALSVNASFLPQALAAHELSGMRFAMGAMMLVRRGLLDAAGGFRRLSLHLADDYLLGREVERLGHRIALARPVVTAVPADWGPREHLLHLVRWARTIRVCQPQGYVASAVVHSLPAILLHMALTGGPGPAFLLATVLSARMAAVAWIHLRCTGNRAVLAQLPLVPLNEAVQFFVWLAGFSSREVLWRGERYRVLPCGTLAPRAESPEAAASVR